MDTFENKSISHITEKIIKSFGEGSPVNKISLGSNSKRKIIMRRFIQSIHKQQHLIMLEQKKPETQAWEFSFADVTLIKTGDVTKNKEEDYKYIGFDISINLIHGLIYKSFFIKFSYHSLDRIIERCDMSKLSTSHKMKQFLSSMIKPIFQRCLAMYEELHEDFKNTENNIDKILEKRESYIVENNLFIPIVMQIGKDNMNKPAFSFTIKTVMPKTYKGAQKTIKTMQLSKVKESIFDYTYILSPLIKITDLKTKM